MERVKEKPNRRAALKAAFPVTIPVLTGYGCLGLAYGLLMAANGYGPLWSTLMSAIGFGGSMQYVAITLRLSPLLPPAMMGLLVVYCLKDVAWLSTLHGAPELLAIAAVVLLYRRKGNVLLSIAGGTALYMLLQAVFA